MDKDHFFSRTDLMARSGSWEADSLSARETFAVFLLNPKFLYRLQKSPLPACLLSQMNAVHMLQI